jgi:hypothetical protein
MAARLPQNFNPVVTTTHFQFFVGHSLPAGAQAVAQSLGAACESDYGKLMATFGGSVPGHLPFNVYLNDITTGASHPSCSSTEISIGYVPNAASTPAGVNDYHAMMLMAEVVEVFSSKLVGWPCSESTGEGLSRVLARELHPGGESTATVSAHVWLKQSPRPDWISRTRLSDVDPIAVGCSVLFLNWLNRVKMMAWSDIVARGGLTLAATYQALTGSGNAWSDFSADMQARWAPGTAYTAVTDQPF